jgi:FkbM family methyltransferase
MRRALFLLVFSSFALGTLPFSFAASSLHAKDHFSRSERRFSSWKSKPLELLSLFLPVDPTIVQTGEYRGDVGASLAQYWPKGRILSVESNPIESVLLDQWCFDHEIDRIDCLYLNLQGSEVHALQNAPKTLKGVTCIAVHSSSAALGIGAELTDVLQSSGFQLFSLWNRDAGGIDAVFVKKSYFLNEATNEYLKTHKIDGSYHKYYEPFFKTYYDLDDQADTIKQTLKQGLAYEGNIGIIISELVRPGTLALDVGSHIGVHTVTMSRGVGPKGAVMAFEPNKKSYTELLNTLRINSCDNVIPICKALSDQPQTVVLNSMKIAQGNEDTSHGDSVDTIALDSLNLKKLSLIKMDVENYEYFVLKGAKETILKNKPVIIFECWIGANYEKSAPKEKANFDRVISLFKSYGYEIYVIYCNDFIAFPADATGALAEYRTKFKKLDLAHFDLGL